MKITVTLLMSIPLILLTACSPGKVTADPLINDIWALEFLKGVNYQPDPSSANRPMIEIHLNEKTVTGNTGCNTMNGTVSIEEDQIGFSDLVTTKMFCPDGIEQEFLIALGMANNYKIEKMKLYLYEDDNELMIFQKID